MNYQETLDYLYSFINYGLKRQDRYAPEQMLLERSQAMLAHLNNPQDAYPVIHLTGTKGKGSVGAICAAMLQTAGYKVALFSSPHLQDFRERFRINGQLIEQDELIALVDHIRPVIRQSAPQRGLTRSSYFSIFFRNQTRLIPSSRAARV
jgi:dihydrofolate synthase/folylpolyglutamate synthase